MHAKDVNQIRSESRTGFASVSSPMSNKVGADCAASHSPFAHSRDHFGNLSGCETGIETVSSEMRTIGCKEDIQFPRTSSRAGTRSKAFTRPPLPDDFRSHSPDTSPTGTTESTDAGNTSRRRYASDAQASDMPSYGHEGRSRNGGPRLSIDSGSNQRHLAAALRTRTNSGPNDPQPSSIRAQTYSRDQNGHWDDSTSSQSEVLRSRKSSQTSSADNIRACPNSRLGAANRAGVDVFDDSARSPLMLSRMLRPDLPPEALERVRALQLRREALQSTPAVSKDSCGQAVNYIRAQIEDIDIRGSTVVSSSHSSSGISSAPRPRLSQADRLIAQTRAGPASEPRRIGDLRKDRPTMPPLSNNVISSGEDRSSWSRASHAYEPLRRIASQSAFERSPSTPEMTGRPQSRFSTISRGVTPGPVLASTSSVTNRAATTTRERNLLVSYEIFHRHFLANGASASPNKSRSAPAVESSDLIERVRTFVDTVTTLNAGLRDMSQYVIQCEISSEVDSDAPAPTAMLKNLDQALASLMKVSDNQVRNLGEFLSAFIRADKERSRGRDASAGRSQSELDGGVFGARPDSRVSATAYSQWSPSKRSDLRREGTIGSHGKQHYQQSIDAALGSISRVHNSLRRETRDLAESASVADSHDTHSSLSGGNERRQESALPYRRQDADDPAVSPTMSVGAISQMRNSIHGRSVSELSPGPMSPTDSMRPAGPYSAWRQGPTRSRASLVPKNLTSALRTAAPLSPRRSKLSDPSVATAIATSSSTLAMSSVDTDDAPDCPLGRDEGESHGYSTLPRSQSSTIEGLQGRRLCRRSTMSDSRRIAAVSPASSSTATTVPAQLPGDEASGNESLSRRSSTTRVPQYRYSIAATSVDSVTLPDPGGDETHGELLEPYTQRTSDRRFSHRRSTAAAPRREDPVSYGHLAEMPAPTESTPPTSARSALQYASQTLGRLSNGVTPPSSVSERRSLADLAAAIKTEFRGTDQSVWASADRQYIVGEPAEA